MTLAHNYFVDVFHQKPNLIMWLASDRHHWGRTFQSPRGQKKRPGTMNTINEKAFAILGTSAAISTVTAFAVWGVVVVLIAVI